MGISEAVADRYNEYFLRHLIMPRYFVERLEIVYFCEIAAGIKPRSPGFERWLDDYYGRCYIDAPVPEPFIGPLLPAPFVGQGYAVVSVPLDARPAPPGLPLNRIIRGLRNE